MNRYGIGLGMLLFAVLLGACAAGPMSGMQGEHTGMTGMETQMGEAGHMGTDEHGMAAAHSIPEEAAAMPNPIAISDASVAAGQATFAQYCVACHGVQGEGDGPGAAGLSPKPADLHADHVQGLSDGALLYVITHGREGTAMAAWESILSEQQRWEVVNFLRTFEADGH